MAKKQLNERQRREIIAAIIQLSEQMHMSRPYLDHTPTKIKYIQARLRTLRAQLNRSCMKKFYNLKTDVDHALVFFTAVFVALINIVLFAYFAVSGWSIILAVAIAVGADIGFVKYAATRGFFYKVGLNAMGAEDQAESKEDQS